MDSKTTLSSDIVPIDSAASRFDEHDPSSKLIVEEASAPATEGANSISQMVLADALFAQVTEVIPAEGGASASADKGKQPASSDQPEVAG